MKSIVRQARLGITCKVGFFVVRLYGKHSTRNDMISFLVDSLWYRRLFFIPTAWCCRHENRILQNMVCRNNAAHHHLFPVLELRRLRFLVCFAHTSVSTFLCVSRHRGSETLATDYLLSASAMTTCLCFWIPIFDNACDRHCFAASTYSEATPASAKC